MVNTVLFLSIGVLAAILFMKFVARRRLRRAGVREVGALEALELINNRGAIVVDVRESREFHAGRIPNARHLPLRHIAARLRELEKAKDRPVVVGCRSGRRSATASIFMRRKGFKQVYNLKGGLMAWRKAKLFLER